MLDGVSYSVEVRDVHLGIRRAHAVLLSATMLGGLVLAGCDDNVEVFSSSFFDAHYMTTDLGGAVRVCEEKGLPDVQVSLDFQEAAVGVDDLGLGFQLMLASFFVLCQ